MRGVMHHHSMAHHRGGPGSSAAPRSTDAWRTTRAQEACPSLLAPRDRTNATDHQRPPRPNTPDNRTSRQLGGEDNTTPKKPAMHSAGNGRTTSHPNTTSASRSKQNMRLQQLGTNATRRAHPGCDTRNLTSHMPATSRPRQQLLSKAGCTHARLSTRNPTQNTSSTQQPWMRERRQPHKGLKGE